jgi:hypothetical protein
MPLIGSRMPDYGQTARSTGKLMKNRRSTEARAHELLTADPKALMDTLSLCVAAGVGFLLSPTSDGGALSVTVYAGDKRERDYAGNPDDWAQLLAAVRDFCEAAMYQGTKEGSKVAQRPTT